MNTPVNFELAKPLKEKGFLNGTLQWYHRYTKKLNTNDFVFSMNKLTDNYSAPTIADVVMWLYEKHGIWLFPDYYNKDRFYYVIKQKDKRNIQSSDFYTSPTEAYEAAIEYTLKNLI